MIQIIGTTEVYFNSEYTMLEDIKYHLIRTLENYEIINHDTTAQKNKIKIKFTLNMEERYECKSLLDYNSYALKEFKKRLPSTVDTSYIQTIDIRTAPGKVKNRFS
ncbi:hypothetical protein GCM10011351_28140 [Paraliobacillus quinghaiensis]|uniref:Uncharacterized protein n=1 Tax=Paraliobacillus quinghaiensis TaxID=470815 RepID=A0A917WYL6_9BACI|nr:hypothetical protein [Paraliobacillus quinghaiensis]GGM40381.1 hypothetical protein GCM10011351_28140 [Paraliobacillus quinghaiensis]